jgi:hypothetical protein
VPPLPELTAVCGAQDTETASAQAAEVTTQVTQNELGRAPAQFSEHKLGLVHQLVYTVKFHAMRPPVPFSFA